VNVDRHLPLAAQPLGHADVIEVGVGQDQGGDLAGLPAQLAEHGPQRVPGGGDAGIDDRQAPLPLDQVPVDVGVLDPVDAGRRVALECLEAGHFAR
jgi:hypothetical protein